jgi:hypothetical protein
LRWDCESLAAKSNVVVDLYAFHPKSLCATDEPLEAIRTDLKARARFALPVSPSGDDDAFRAALAAVRAVAAGEPWSTTEAEENLRRAVAVAGEFLRVNALRDSRALALAGTLVADDTLPGAVDGKLEGAVHSVEQSLGAFREALEAASRREDVAAVAQGAREYLAHGYTRYLATLGAALRKRDKALALPRLKARLRAVRAAEARRRAAWGLPSVWRSDEGERQLHKLSQLKKYFQGAIYADVDRKLSVSRRLREPAAAAAAALAATWALFAERFALGSAGRPALDSALWMAPALMVCAYVLKDRLKDRSKQLFERTAEKLWSSVDEHLFLGDKPVGRQRDRLRWAAGKTLSEVVLRLRGAAYATPLEAKVPEDVFHWRLEQSYHPERAAVAKFGRRWSLRTSLRINFERCLRHLDEPFKTVWALDHDGDTREARCRRTYAIHIAVVTQRTVEPARKRAFALRRGKPSRAEAPAPTLFRVLLDRDGVRKIERVEGMLSPAPATPSRECLA